MKQTKPVICPMCHKPINDAVRIMSPHPGPNIYHTTCATKRAIKELTFESLGAPERRLLLQALDKDVDHLHCKFCEQEVFYQHCCIMPAVEGDHLCTILCAGPVCMAKYIADYDEEDMI